MFLLTLLYTVFAYAASAIFIFGLAIKMFTYARTPNPLKIVLTPAPTNLFGAAFRVAGEFVFFKGLYKGDKWTWLGSYIFHGAFLLVILRHLRYFIYPVPTGIMNIQTPGIYAGYILPLATIYLLMRRTTSDRMLFISSMADYFALLLIFTIAFTGLLLKYYTKPYLVDIKAFILGLTTFKLETVPADPLFLIHFTLVMVLLAYFPFSKLLHSGGIFFSPTINQVDNCWEKRHINPWEPNYKLF